MKLVQALLFVFLIAAAAFRFGAEANVRAAERELRDVRAEVAAVADGIEDARLDVEVLESASRLSALNGEFLRLRTVQADQLVDEYQFAGIVGVEAAPPALSIAPDADVIGNAISMADVQLAARLAAETGGQE